MDIHYIHYPIMDILQERPNNTKKTPEKRCTKNPLFAAILSFVIPGLGQCYNSQIKKGIFFIIITIVGIIEMITSSEYIFIDTEILTLVTVLLICFIGFWIFNIKDAYNTALKANENL